MRSLLLLCLLFWMGASELSARQVVREVQYVHPRGWFLANISVNPLQNTTGDLFTEDDLVRVSGATQVVTANENGFWRVYLPNVGLVARPVEGGRAYLLLFPVAGNFSLRGTPWGKEACTVRLAQGLNLVGMPRGIPSGYSLSQLATALGANALCRTDEEGRLSAFVPGLTADEMIDEREGFLVNSSVARTVSLTDAIPPQFLLYFSGESGSGQIWRMDADGRSKCQLTFGCATSAPISGPEKGQFSFSSSRMTTDDLFCGNGTGFYSQNINTGQSVTRVAYTTDVAIMDASESFDDTSVVFQTAPFPGFGQYALNFFSYGAAAWTRIGNRDGDLEQGTASFAGVADGPIMYFTVRDARGFWIYRQPLASVPREVITSPGDTPGFAMSAPKVDLNGKYLYATRAQLKGTSAIVPGTGDIYRLRLDGRRVWDLVYAHPDSDESVTDISDDGNTLYMTTTAAEAGGWYNLMAYDLRSKSVTYLTSGSAGNILGHTAGKAAEPLDSLGAIMRHLRPAPFVVR